MIKREWALMLALAFALAGALGALKAIRIDQMRGDTAIFEQTTENIAAGRRAVSQVFANTQGFIDGQYVVMSAARAASDPLVPPQPAERDMLRFHEYLILYLLAPFAKVFSVQAVLFSAYALTFAGMLALTYYELRLKRLSVGAAALFVLLVAASPAWWQSALWGQFFPDRLFVFAGLAFMIAASRANVSRGVLLTLAAFCLLINERAAITAGLFALLYVGFSWRTAAKDRMLRVGIGVVLLAYGLIVTKYVIHNPSYANFLPHDLRTAMREWSLPMFAAKAGMLALVNLPLLLLAFFDRRAGVIAVLLLLPNVFGSIGGAEKIGWSTHYHSYYFPVLVWAALTGYAAMYKQAMVAGKAYVPYVAAGALAVFLCMLDPSSFERLRFGPDQIANSFFVRFPKEASTYLTPAGLQFRDMAREVADAVPPGSVVTTPEAGMPFLYEGRTIRFFPIDIDRADYAVVTDLGKIKGKEAFGGAANYLGQDEVLREDALLVARMHKDGYDFARAVRIQGLDLVIVPRHGSASAMSALQTQEPSSASGGSI